MRRSASRDAAEKRLFSARVAAGDPGAIADVVLAVGWEGGHRSKGAARLGITLRTLGNWVRGCPKLADQLAKLPKRKGPGRPAKMPVREQLPKRLARIQRRD